MARKKTREVYLVIRNEAFVELLNASDVNWATTLVFFSGKHQMILLVQKEALGAK